MTPKTRKELIWEKQERDTFNVPLAIKTAAAVLFAAERLLRPFVRFRLGLLYHRAMGRFYGCTEYFLRLRALRPTVGRECAVLVSGNPVNAQILTMIARKIPVFRCERLYALLGEIKKAYPDHPMWIDLNQTGWLRREWIEAPPQLSFTPDEHARGRALLRKLGVPEGARHVCFFAKDRGYADNPLAPPDPNSYWGTRDFRNCDIKSYLAAADYLSKQGIWCFRMGMHQPEALLPDDLDRRIVDYTGRIRPTLDDADFADTYLQATCKFFLGTTSGIYILSSMFGVPVAYAHMLPYGECGRMPHDIVIFKNSRDRRTGRLIPYREMIARGVDADWLTEDELNRLDAEGIAFVDNSAEEVLELAREMNQRLDGDWRPAPEDDELQRRFIALSPARHLDGSGFPGRVGAGFLRKHKDLLI